MQKYRKPIIIAIAALSISGCALLEVGADVAGLGAEYDLAKSEVRKKVGQGINRYCRVEGLSIETRKAALAEINAAAAPAKISAFDCNGDGQPDF